jgi:hypothetical protein
MDRMVRVSRGSVLSAGVRKDETTESTSVSERTKLESIDKARLEGRSERLTTP